MVTTIAIFCIGYHAYIYTPLGRLVLEVLLETESAFELYHISSIVHC